MCDDDDKLFDGDDCDNDYCGVKLIIGSDDIVLIFGDDDCGCDLYICNNLMLGGDDDDDLVFLMNYY